MHWLSGIASAIIRNWEEKNPHTTPPQTQLSLIRAGKSFQEAVLFSMQCLLHPVINILRMFIQTSTFIDLQFQKVPAI